MAGAVRSSPGARDFRLQGPGLSNNTGPEVGPEAGPEAGPGLAGARKRTGVQLLL